MKPQRYAEGKGGSSVDRGGGEDKPTADTMPDGDAVPMMSQLDLQASAFAVSPKAFAPVAVVPAVVAPIHDGASRWSKNVVAPQPRRQRGVIGK